MTPAARLPLLVAGFLSLLAGTAAGLARLGWEMPASAAALAALHGPLMASAFFGTVIGLERAVALGAAWAWLGPLGAAAGGLALILGAYPVGLMLLGAGSVVFLLGSLVILKRQPRLHHACLAAGAACWLAANACLLAGLAPLSVVPGWIGFLVYTIGGERLELSRVMPPSPAAKRLFAAIALALLPSLALGWRATGACLLALSVWLATQDVALRTIRAKGLARYIAACLLAGYAWLALASLVMLAAPDLPAGSLSRDAALHAVFLGFVFSMVFGHAPIIVPALFRVPLPWHAWFYAPLALLHATLALRVAADLLALPAARAFGGAGNAAALALFILSMIAAVLRGPGR